MADTVVAIVDRVVAMAQQAGATDLHFEPLDDGVLVRLRLDSVLHDAETLPGALATGLVARLKVLSGLLTYRTDVPQEGTYRVQDQDVRVSTFPTIRGERVVLRFLAAAGKLLTLEQLGHADALVDELRRVLRLEHGLLLVCGPAGSGKTTTLYALLHALQQQAAGVSIFSIEDPVEIRLEGVTQVQVAPARGLDYPAALRSLLRQDPQILMIGEIRDRETADVVLEAALTGHLVLSTLHSGNPLEALVRLREMDVPGYQVATALRGVLAQRLVRRTCVTCSGAGDACCRGTGYRGRAAIGQWLPADPAVKAWLQANQDPGQLQQTQTLSDDARRLLTAGLTNEDEVRRVLASGV